MRITVLVGVATLLISSLAWGESPFNPEDPVQGKYSGVMMVGGLPQPVWLEISSLVPGKVGAILRYSEPRSKVCNDWEYGGPGRDAHYFYAPGYGCKFGGRARAKILAVRLMDSGGIKYELRESKDSVLETQILMPE